MVAVHGRKDFYLADGTKAKDKELWWVGPDGTPGLGGRPVASLPLYGITDLADAAPDEPVVLVEGEPKRDALFDRGILAVATVTGAKTTHAPEAFRPLLGRRAILWADNDGDGARHMELTAARLQQIGHTDVYQVTWPDAPPKGDAFDFFAVGNTVEQARALLASATAPSAGTNGLPPYIETITEFCAEEDPPVDVVFPDLLPCGVVMLIHGPPRSRKTLAAWELALSAATGTAPFGLERFRPAAAVSVLYLQEEDPRSLTRPRLRRLVRDRCGDEIPETLHVAVRRGVDLDDPAWVTRLIEDMKRLDVKLLVLDAARRLSAKTDEGPAKVRELTAVLRSIVTTAGVTIVIVHHDTKPPVNGQDQRPRSQRASGGDWFAACECPVSMERVNETESLVFPQDYKFSGDPAPFTFAIALDGRLIRRLDGADATTERAESVGVRGKVLAWLRVNGPASKSRIKKAGFGWETIDRVLDGLLKDGTVDTVPGRNAGSNLYVVASAEPSPESQDDSARDATIRPQNRLFDPSGTVQDGSDPSSRPPPKRGTGPRTVQQDGPTRTLEAGRATEEMRRKARAARAPRR